MREMSLRDLSANRSQNNNIQLKINIIKCTDCIFGNVMDTK